MASNDREFRAVPLQAVRVAVPAVLGSLSLVVIGLIFLLLPWIKGGVDYLDALLWLLMIVTGVVVGIVSIRSA